MKETRFVWLAASGFPRRGPALIKGSEYAIADFDEAIVAEWVKTGAAKYLKTKPEKGGGE